MRNYLIALITTISFSAYGQLSIPSELKTIQQQLQQATGMSYDYSIEQRLPDGTVNRTKGRVVRGSGFYKETNTAQVVIQTDKWLYKLDHASKSIFIIDLVKVKDKVFQGKVSSSPMPLIADSVLLRYGKASVKRVGDIAKVTIGFTKELLLDRVYLEYDMKRKIPIAYSVHMKTPYGIDGWNYEEKFADQTVTAVHFDLQVKEEAKLSDYFTYQGGKIKLKKYAQYKLIQQI